MLRVVFSGGPGAGKTTLLDALQRRGYARVDESARAVIRERLARGLTPRPSPVEFAREILRRDTQAYDCVQAGVVFFDRGVVDALGMLDEARPLPAAEIASTLRRYPYHRAAFLLPPWREIYVGDAERDQTFDDAVRVFDALVGWYRRCGYEIVEVPRGDVTSRCEFVLQSLDLAWPGPDAATEC